MSKSLSILIGTVLIGCVSGVAMAQSTNDATAPAMTGATGTTPAMQKLPKNTDANPAASSEKPAQPGGPSGTGAAAKTNGDTSK